MQRNFSTFFFENFLKVLDTQHTNLIIHFSFSLLKYFCFTSHYTNIWWKLCFDFFNFEKKKNQFKFLGILQDSVGVLQKKGF